MNRLRLLPRIRAQGFLLLLAACALALAAYVVWARVGQVQGNANLTRERRVGANRSNTNENTEGANVGVMSSEPAGRGATVTDSTVASGRNARAADFSTALEQALRRRGMRVEDACPREDSV
ncbi:MAG TPA: hypothetical protein VK619_11805, partial [Pyrinomonadaceae bacterium]|nr:hypothetical protein [Pyrinomonadaceae bacterium]